MWTQFIVRKCSLMMMESILAFCIFSCISNSLCSAIAELFFILNGKNIKSMGLVYCGFVLLAKNSAVHWLDIWRPDTGFENAIYILILFHRSVQKLNLVCVFHYLSEMYYWLGMQNTSNYYFFLCLVS